MKIIGNILGGRFSLHMLLYIISLGFQGNPKERVLDSNLVKQRGPKTLLLVKVPRLL